jgi:hypothetical protein
LPINDHDSGHGESALSAMVLKPQPSTPRDIDAPQAPRAASDELSAAQG